MTRKPWEPTPMKAILILSLGATYPGPPNTRRGTIEKPIAAAAVRPMNLRRETGPTEKLRDRNRSFTVPLTAAQIPHDLLAAGNLQRVALNSAEDQPVHSP